VSVYDDVEQDARDDHAQNGYDDDYDPTDEFDEEGYCCDMAADGYSCGCGEDGLDDEEEW
jgi:hypothetical protein